MRWVGSIGVICEPGFKKKGESKVPLIETAAVVAVKAVTVKAVNEFNSKIMQPFFESKKAQTDLIKGFRSYLRLCEKKQGLFLQSRSKALSLSWTRFMSH